MKAEFTPGKWEIDKKEPTRILCDGGNTHIDIRYYDNKEKEAIANAKLIAASPELFENLVRLIDRIEENDYNGDFPSAYNRAKKLITKIIS